MLFPRTMYLRPALVAFVAGLTPAQAQDIRVSGPDALEFSTQNMDLGADPAVDFQRFAAGGWIDRVERPARIAAFGMAAIMHERLKQRILTSVMQAAREADTAEAGSPKQQVGAFFKAYMNVDARDAAGIEPLRAELEAIAAIADREDLVRYLGRWMRFGGPSPLAAIVPSPDLADNTRHALFVLGSDAALTGLYASVYDEAPDSPPRAAYRTYVTDLMTVAGYTPERAAAIAQLTDDLEVELFKGLPTPAEKVNPLNSYKPMALAELQAQVPEFDLPLFFRELGFEVPERVVLYTPRYFPVLSKILREHELADIRDYLAYRLVNQFSDVLTTDFEGPILAFRETMTGVAVQPSREDRALELMTKVIGQPLGHLYVNDHFPETAKQQATEVIDLIRDAFLARIPTREWLTDQTRAEALEKAKALSYKVGYPEQWIDYSGVRIGADPVANLIGLGLFGWERVAADIDGPVKKDPFNGSSTLPSVINAAYAPSDNGFQVPAAFLQAPVFDAAMDPAVKLCRLGATLGHEMTHGFDSMGRNFDAVGNLRNWWTPEDEQAFNAEAHKLVEQADAWEALPGLYVRGDQTIGENMADVGGINFAYDALMAWLEKHPADNVDIDGFTPAQRCFIAWTQLWTEKTTDAFVRNQVTTNPHPPNNYRATAAIQHVDGFYEAFGIKEGDPMWLAPEKRVRAW